MEITEHQANMLRALADKKTLQFREILPEGSSSFAYEYANIHDLGSALLFINSDKYEVRIKPDVIVVNGIEVPAPEKVPPKVNTTYFFPVLNSSVLYAEDRWEANGHLEGHMDKRMLDRGLVFLVPEHAVAMAEAMLAHKPG